MPACSQRRPRGPTRYTQRQLAAIKRWASRSAELSKNRREFENKINGSKMDPGQLSQDFYESVAGPRRMYVSICGSAIRLRCGSVTARKWTPIRVRFADTFRKPRYLLLCGGGL
ncbi:hypothetical protein DPX16_0645 [Anabarilius grahami]|uniref:Uncharacterized protein n=1 Tax=Anabarilius grahami TaxID=495550 RepID=A0A3N0YGS5_ANAGA|nr:hypothetical protein DPX16_0645 [Anabarilius grahami]